MLFDGETMPDIEVYRFSVKCNRAFCRRVTDAARAAGVSVNDFVQRHFDRILDPKVPPAKHFDEAAFDANAFARRHRVRASAAKAWAYMASQADRDGRLKATVGNMAEGARMDCEFFRKCIKELIEAGVLTRLNSHSGKSGSTYRISEGAA